MIDWISATVDCRHDRLLQGGYFVNYAATGEVEYEVIKRLSVRGSYESALQVRTVLGGPEQFTHVEISGNPAKFFQGHNLWGTSDVVGLVAATMQRLSESDLGFNPTAKDRASWYSGDFRLGRVDVTESFHLANRADVLAWLRAAEGTAHLAHRGRGQLVKGSTLYFGKNSRRWALKLYAKGQEIEAKGHGQEAIQELPAAIAWADRTLRAELVLRAMELRRLGLDVGHAWNERDGVPFNTSVLLTDRLGAMTMTTKSTLPVEIIETLTSAQRLAYIAWASGTDLRGELKDRSFYRLRSKLLPHGIDIATAQPKENSNVVPLIRVLEAVPAQVPDWAQGTLLYFEPPRRAA